MPSILLIEDEPGIAGNVIYALETEGMDVTWCATGEAGRLHLCDNNSVDLIVLDVGLPDINGFTLFPQLNTIRRTPTIFLTARQQEVDRIVGLEMGADDYVSKPFSPRELAARIRSVLRRCQSPPEPQQNNDGADCQILEIDHQAKRITYHSQPLELTAYQYVILQQFIEHPGQVLSRSQLMTNAWDEHDIALERTVDSHIKTIRAKLRAIDPDNDPIVTHRGHGYAYRPKSATR